MPLLDQGSELVSGKGHSVEVEEHITSLDILGNEADLAVCLVLCKCTSYKTLTMETKDYQTGVLLKISKRNFENTVLKTFGSDLGTLCAVDKCFADFALMKKINKNKLRRKKEKD